MAVEWAASQLISQILAIISQDGRENTVDRDTPLVRHCAVSVFEPVCAFHDVHHLRQVVPRSGNLRLQRGVVETDDPSGVIGHARDIALIRRNISANWKATGDPGMP